MNLLDVDNSRHRDLSQEYLAIREFTVFRINFLWNLIQPVKPW
jgi:hypothetical protein